MVADEVVKNEIYVYIYIYFILVFLIINGTNHLSYLTCLLFLFFFLFKYIRYMCIKCIYLIQVLPPLNSNSSSATACPILTGLEVGPKLLYNQINYVFFAVRSQLIKTKRKENLLYKRNLLVFRCASFRIIDHRIQWFIVSYMTCKNTR